MKFCGMEFRTYSEAEIAEARRYGKRIVTGERGYRLVSYHYNGNIYISHEVSAIDPDSASG